MRCYAQFYGGSSYSHPEADQCEVFDSLKEAVQIFEYRTSRDSHFPCTDENACMTVWFGEPEGDFPCDGANIYPDRQIYLGPRGGVRVERT